MQPWDVATPLIDNGIIGFRELSTEVELYRRMDMGVQSQAGSVI